jgi:hypothetical protein
MSDVLTAPRPHRAPTRPAPRHQATPAGLLGLHVADPIPGIDPEPVLEGPSGLGGRVALVALRVTVLVVMAASAVAFGMALSRGVIHWPASMSEGREAEERGCRSGSA